MRRTLLVAVVSLLAVPLFLYGSAQYSKSRLAELRSQGPAGLQKLLGECSGELAKGPRPNDGSWRRVADAIDTVAAQRDAWASKLYWYTDLDQAKSAAATQGKPILSLRLLGTLDTELSCANSRFFRTTLYPDPRVNTLLREKFILHWSSERPVPVVTVDYGDGRTMKRTVTGNSIHYVLDATGRPIDALPGLYSASAFVGTLKRSLRLAASNPSDEQLREWHATASQKPPRAYVEEALKPEVTQLVRMKAAPPAQVAGMRARSKVLVEDPLARVLGNLQTSIAQDTNQNENVLHRQIHERFASGQAGDFVHLNEWVYAEVFLTPRSDPWLGLAPADAFPALDGNGLAQR